jgi:hypothetical protein
VRPQGARLRGIEVNPSLWSVLRLSQVCLGRGAGNAPVPRFCRAFRSVDVAVNHLKVWHSILEKVAIEEPFRMFDAMVVLAKVSKMDVLVTHQNGFVGAKTKDQVLQQVEEKAGPS